MVGFSHRLSARPAGRPAEPLDFGAAELAAATTPPLAVERLDSTQDFEAISQVADDLVANGRLTKFLIDRRNPGAQHVYFVNSNYTRDGQVPPEALYHFYFARAFLDIPETNDEFNAVTYFKPEKRYVAGAVHTYVLEGSAEPVYGIQAYVQDTMKEDQVLETVRTLLSRLAIPGVTYAFVPTGRQQTVGTVAAELAALGVEVLPLDRILGATDYLPLNLGEAWGHLRIFPEDLDDLRPTDIPVFDELPLDLSVVAGVLTKAVQDTNSHVNLKSKERDTPNAVLRSASPEHPQLAPLADQPVHLVVARGGLTLEATTEQEVADRLAARMAGPLRPLSVVPETRIRSFDEMASGSLRQARELAPAYGTKATNLGFLAHREVLGRLEHPGSPSADAGYELVPQGFGVPLQAYVDFVAHNSALRELVDRLVTDEQAGRLSPKELAARTEQVRAAFMDAAFPPGALEALRAAVDGVLPGVTKVKVRSSANAEDVPNFDGAGLHDSLAADTGKPDDPTGPCQLLSEPDGGEVKKKVKPKSLGCAVKAVYASLWNKRAVEERSFARIGHRAAAMGLCVVPSYDAESDVAANAVVVTRVLNTEHIYGYSLSLQQGNNLVTNPDPGTWSEQTVAGFYSDDEPPSLTTLRLARARAEGPDREESVLPNDRTLEIVELTKAIERAYCSATPEYYPVGDCRQVPFDPGKPASLDLELKILDDGHLVFKQVREFGGR